MRFFKGILGISTRIHRVDVLYNTVELTCSNTNCNGKHIIAHINNLNSFNRKLAQNPLKFFSKILQNTGILNNVKN